MVAHSEAFQTHLGQEVTTICYCWRLTRSDGHIMGFTDHDQIINCDGTNFSPETGFTASEARQSVGLATDAMDVEGALSSNEINEDDIIAGLYDGAKVEALLVNWQNPEQFTVIRSSIIGQIVRKDGRFIAELENRSGLLNQTLGRTVKRSCDADLGDQKCRVDILNAFMNGAGIVERVGENSVWVSGLGSFESGWFSNGVLSWSSGSLKGRRDRIAFHGKELTLDRLDLWRMSSLNIQAGMTFTVLAGCDKSFSTCKVKFNNVLNFRGFPHLPGDDAVYAYVSEGAIFDGGALVK